MVDGPRADWGNPHPQHLKRTLCITLIVGTVFFTRNQLGVILDGRATVVVWIKAALTYLTPPARLQFRPALSHARRTVQPRSPSRRWSGKRDHHQPSQVL